MLLLRILLVSLGLAASLQAGDRGLADSSALTAGSDSQETTLANKTDSTPKNDAVTRPNDSDAARPTSPPAPSTATDTGSSSELDFPQEPSSSNPWLYIIIGFLLITGILLYVDPRIF